MKVRCIDIESLVAKVSGLTLNKTYEVLDQGDHSILIYILNDENKNRPYSKHRFVKVEDEDKVYTSQDGDIVG